ncbi:MAG: carboxypeptidase regulatory-like domain-containing protein [Opitutaceae bacterium]|jgi:hypothetical protein
MKRTLAGVFTICVLLAATTWGQGITTSALNGSVTTKEGQPIAGATVRAVHTPTNTVFTAVTTNTGRFAITGLPVGGPYTVEAKSPSYTFNTLGDVQTQLGESTEVLLVPATIGAEVVQLEKVTAYASVIDLDSGSTGASSALNSRRILAQPTVNRSFSDMMKTNPFVSIRKDQAVQALGMSNRYNTITLDGARINDSFGINSSGLFSLNNPFSLDAIEQFNMSLTPYDVSQSGFAGVALNVVSKSGTNEFHGTLYDIFTDSNWGGRDISGTSQGKRPFSKERTYGGTFGGPILKNRLFFFLSFERYIKDSAPTSAAFTPSSTFIDAVTARIAQLPGAIDLGSFGGASTAREFDTKRMAKLDWNINENHRMSLRYSDTIGARPNLDNFNATSFSQPSTITGQPSSFGNGTTCFDSNFFMLDVKERVWATQIFSNWTPELKTQFSYSKTRQDSVRDTPVNFPEIRILNVPGISGTGATISTSNAIRFGTEISSMGNELHAKTDTFSGSADYSWETFTFTLGADREASDYLNIYRQGSYGVFDYYNLADFQNDKPFGFLRSVVQAGFPISDRSKFEQVGVFGQVRWEPISRLNLTLGMRVDYLGSPIAPPENTAFKTAFGLTNAGTIDGTNVPAPRVSFNYALDRKRNTQIRGGIGVFLGRNPWVWNSNSYSYTGLGRYTVLKTATSPTATSTYAGPTLTQYLNGTYSNTDAAYRFDASNPIGVTSTTGTSSTINLIKPGMKLPTIQRGNIAIDRKLPFLDAVLSLEYITTEQLTALFVDNMNLKPTTVGIDGRQLFAGSSAAAPRIAGFGNVIRTRDIHAGKSQYASITLDRPFKNGWAYTLSYTRGHATEAQTLVGSTANSQWQFNAVFNQNQVEVARSDYEIRDRVQASVSREFQIRGNLVTTVSVYYEGRTGIPYSMVYSSDLNKDGFIGNDLVAVPSGPNDARFDFSGMTSAEQAAYFNYINNSALARYTGSYAPRNALLTPWQNRLDLRIVQELPAYRNVKVELFADFLNFGHFLCKELFNYSELFNPLSGGQVRPFGAATYTSAGLIKPTFNDYTVPSRPTPILSYDSTTGSLLFVPSLAQLVNTPNENRWKVQAGVKLKF